MFDSLQLLSFLARRPFDSQPGLFLFIAKLAFWISAWILSCSWPNRPSGSWPGFSLVLNQIGLLALGQDFLAQCIIHPLLANTCTLVNWYAFFLLQHLVFWPQRCIYTDLIACPGLSSINAMTWQLGGRFSTLQSHSLMAMLATAQWCVCTISFFRWSLQSHSLMVMLAAARWFGCAAIMYGCLMMACVGCTMANARWLLLDNMDARWLLLDDGLMKCAQMARWQMSDGCYLMMFW